MGPVKGQGISLNSSGNPSTVRRPLRATQCRSGRVEGKKQPRKCGHISFQTASIQLTHMEDVTLFNKEEIKGFYQVSKTLTLFFFTYMQLIVEV